MIDHPVSFRWFWTIKVLCRRAQCLPNGTVWWTHLNCGVSWLSGLVHWTQVLVLSECGFESVLTGYSACVLEQDSKAVGPVCCVVHVKERRTLIVKENKCWFILHLHVVEITFCPWVKYISQVGCLCVKDMIGPDPHHVIQPEGNPQLTSKVCVHVFVCRVCTFCTSPHIIKIFSFSDEYDSRCDVSALSKKIQIKNYFCWHINISDFVVFCYRPEITITVFSILTCLTPSLRRPCIHAIFFPTTCRTACKHAFCFLRVRPEAVSTRHSWLWQTLDDVYTRRCFSESEEHASVPPDKRHCRQGMSEWNGMSEWIFA